MVTKHVRPWLALAIAALSTHALGSGGPAPQPAYVTSRPVVAADWAALTAGRPGIVKAATSDGLLYADWRALNGLRLDDDATRALATPCCGSPGNATFGWLQARRALPDVSDVYFLSTEREGPNYTSIPNCFDDAFVTATATLADRVRRYGKDAPAVRSWLAAQNAVFDACGKPGVTLPPLPAGAPDWLRADHDYQAAALALYDGRAEEAAARFAAIGKDRRSPWQPMALYLQARALQRAAKDAPSPARFAAARAAIARVVAAPATTYGRGEAVRMQQVLEFRERPAQLLARLDLDLSAPAPMPDVAVAFRDYMTLSDRTDAKPEAADWIRTLQPKDRADALAHAQERWRTGGKAAWLIAALSLAEPGDTATAGLLKDAARIPGDSPAWPTARYHLLRLTIATADPAATRAQADAALARNDLSRSDRNAFLAIRTQRATDPADFVRHAVRTPQCDPADTYCASGDWPYGDGLLARQGGSFVGFGPDARAIIDLMPLPTRVALTADATIPVPLRLDIALTSYARAVQLQDHAAIDRLAGMLVTLLPQLAEDWRRIAATRPGPEKRFAEFMAMAKLPSLRVDLADYERPVGAEKDFSGYWVDWMLAGPRGGSAVPPALAGIGLPVSYLGTPADVLSDLTCMERCGVGAFPLYLPGFVAATLPQARAERRRFVVAGRGDAPTPQGATSLWDETLAYARAHPADPRAPEALYRLIRVARWGANHDHIGRRAFKLLHARYPKSTWTRMSPYFYDS